MAGRTDDSSSARATIQDVAAAAGVSTGTVSRVLNDRKGVRASTRERVRATIERLDYRPDLAARELSFRQPTRIGLHIHSQARRFTPFFMLFLEHLMSELASDGFRLEEIGSDDHGQPERLSDAMILFGARDNDPRLPYLRNSGVPHVLIGHGDAVRWTRPDDYDGAGQATDHLIGLGHEAIVHISDDLGGQAAFDRYRGYRDALERAGIEARRELLLDGAAFDLGAYRALRKARERGLRFSAVFAGSDEMAIGAIAALDDLGLRVPGDVSVVGFDDLPEVGEGLTTIRQDIPTVAATAVTLVREALRGDPIRQIIVPVRLVQRATTARRR